MRLLRHIVLVNLFAALLMAGAVVALRPRDTHGAPMFRPSNALWIGHSWVAAPPKAAAMRSLCITLRTHNLDEIYVHVGPIDGAGRIVEGRDPDAGRFAAAFHAACPGVRILAWIGQLLPKWDGLLNLHDPMARTALVRTAAHYVGQGFDGVQYDLEPVAADDTAFLDLLRRTRAAIGNHWLAVAGPALLPTGGLPALPHLRLPLTPWPGGYYAAVAALVDEVDPMLYDTSLSDPAAYAAFTAEQARDLIRVLPGVTIRFGLPAFAGRSAVFDDRVENLSSALAGIRQVLPKGTGTAIYALWTMTPAHWAVFDRG